MDQTNTALVAMLAVAAVVALAAYPSLPDEMAMHIDVSGDMSNYLPTPIALAVSPIVLAGLIAYNIIVPPEQKGRSNRGLLMLGAVLFFVHIGFILMNL